MADRKKTTLHAPDGIDESTIEGTVYWPDDQGNVETTNPNHVAVLKQHGFTVVSEASIQAPAKSLGDIDYDELGRAQLFEALKARGQNYPDTATREELATAAAQWNQGRRRGRAAQAVAAENAQVVTDAEKTKADLEPAEFDTMSVPSLKAWLTDHGVEFAPATPKSQLVKAAVSTQAAMIEREAEG